MWRLTPAVSGGQNLMTEGNDIRSLEIRCPRLGGTVTFEYCEIENSGQPCMKAISCWTPYFDIRKVLAKKMGEGNLGAYFDKTPSPKVVTLIELIEKARQTVRNSRDET